MSKLQTAYTSRSCIAQCNVKECGYSLGFCNANPPQNCLRAYGQTEGSCLECSEGFLQYFGYCLEHCPTGFHPHHQFPSMCIEEVDYSSATDPDLLYVFDSTESNRENAYVDFMDALAAAWQSHTVVNLVGSEITFNPKSVYSKHNIDYFRHPSSPDMFAEAPWHSLTIRSLLCSEEELQGCSDSLTTLNFRSVMAYSFTSKTLIFQNVKLSTTAAFHHDLVAYCPTLIRSYSGYDTDQNHPFPDYSVDHFQCVTYWNLELFTVSGNGVLNLAVKTYLGRRGRGLQTATTVLRYHSCWRNCEFHAHQFHQLPHESCRAKCCCL
jgi:hypothetical protein